MKEFSIRGCWAISRNGILFLSRGGQKTKRRERDVRQKRRAKEAGDFEIYKFKATARAMLKTSQNKAAMKVVSSAAA